MNLYAHAKVTLILVHMATEDRPRPFQLQTGTEQDWDQDQDYCNSSPAIVGGAIIQTRLTQKHLRLLLEPVAQERPKKRI